MIPRAAPRRFCSSCEADPDSPAGASAPEEHVQDCIEYLKQKFGATVESRVVREEDVHFPLPRELRVLAN